MRCRRLVRTTSGSKTICCTWATTTAAGVCWMFQANCGETSTAQGREVARLATGDPDGFRSNLPMAWGGQPHNGMIYFNDINSGLWVTRLGKAKMRARSQARPITD